MPTYFVTGGTGFIGRHLLERLLLREGDIHVLVREGSTEKLAAIIVRYEGIEDLLDVLGRGALAVGVLYPQHQRPSRATREQPVVERGASASDVQRPGGRRGEAYAHWRAVRHRRLRLSSPS